LVGGVTLRGPFFPEFQSKSTNHCAFEFSLKLFLQWEFPLELSFSFVAPVLHNKVFCFIFLSLPVSEAKAFVAVFMYLQNTALEI